MFKHETLQVFADKTTMHGFLELYYAKSKFWKVFWCLLLGVASCLTMYQMYNIMIQVIDGNTATIIQPLQEVPDYPPLKICYRDPKKIVNVMRAKQMGVDKSTLLFGMSYLLKMYSTDTFDIIETQKKFLSTMKRLNMSGILEFYSAIANPTPYGFINIPESMQSWNITISLDGRFCYAASNVVVQKALSDKLSSEENSILLTYSHQSVNVDNKFLNDNEQLEINVDYFTRLAGHQLENKSVLKSYENVPRLYADNNIINFIVPTKQTVQANIKLSGTLYKWLKSSKRQCIDKPEVPFEICNKYCNWNEIRNIYPNDCMGIAQSVMFNEDQPEKLCSFGIVFLNKLNQNISNGTMKIYNLPAQPNSLSHNTCVSKYCVTPCKEWKFVSSVSVVSLSVELIPLTIPTMFYIEYPTQNNILVFEEVKIQTWETFIGSIGGIVGLWLGASILSLFQLMYLCCFNDCDAKMSDRTMNK